MATESIRVRPGDIITANFMNDLLTVLDDLRDRVDRLESGGTPGSQVTITGFNPTTQVAVAQPLTITGSNFDDVTANNTIQIGGQPVTQFRVGSTSTELRIIVPEIAAVPPDGMNVTVSVANKNGRAERLYRVLPKVPVIGDPPAITGITRLANGSTQLRVNDIAVIAGRGFDPVPANNRLKFTVVRTGRVYPDPITRLPAIVIDTAASNTTSIRVTIPNMEEILAGEDPSMVDIEVGVGAHVPALFRSPVIRP
jgi:hypothetical protein